MKKSMGRMGVHRGKEFILAHFCCGKVRFNWRAGGKQMKQGEQLTVLAEIILFKRFQIPTEMKGPE